MSSVALPHAIRVAVCVASACMVGCMVGCASTGLLDTSPQGAGSAHTPAGQPLAAQAAMAMIAIGRSTKADVASALGKAIVIAFDSGHEVWVYRWRGADESTRAAAELVVLFAPSGLATKVRLRPGYATRQ